MYGNNLRILKMCATYETGSASRLFCLFGSLRHQILVAQGDSELCQPCTWVLFLNKDDKQELDTGNNILVEMTLVDRRQGYSTVTVTVSVRGVKQRSHTWSEED